MFFASWQKSLLRTIGSKPKVPYSFLIMSGAEHECQAYCHGVLDPANLIPILRAKEYFGKGACFQ